MLPKSQRGNALRAWNDRAESLIGFYLGAFYRHMRDEAKKAASAASGKALDPMTDAQVDTLLGATSAWREIATRYLAEPMNRVALGTVRNAAKVVGGFDVVEIEDPQWLVAAAQRTAQMVRVAVRWKAAIRDEVINAIANDVSVTSLADLIDEKFGDVIRSNGLVIARTEAGMITGQLREKIFRAEGIERKGWSATDDDHTRESHREVDDEVVDIDEHFSNGLMHPGDPAGPPEEIINCRCVAVPVA
jgi:uncharacterized protein with gpF-like domain